MPLSVDQQIQLVSVQQCVLNAQRNLASAQASLSDAQAALSLFLQELSDQGIDVTALQQAWAGLTT